MGIFEFISVVTRAQTRLIEIYSKPVKIEISINKVLDSVLLRKRNKIVTRRQTVGALKARKGKKENPFSLFGRRRPNRKNSDGNNDNVSFGPPPIDNDNSDGVLFDPSPIINHDDNRANLLVNLPASEPIVKQYSRNALQLIGFEGAIGRNDKLQPPIQPTKKPVPGLIPLEKVTKFKTRTANRIQTQLIQMAECSPFCSIESSFASENMTSFGKLQYDRENYQLAHRFDSAFEPNSTQHVRY